MNGPLVTRPRRSTAAAGVAWAALSLSALLAAGCGAPPHRVSSAPVAITVHYSHFEPSIVSVRAGTPVTFALRNDDPIEHEWIVGPAQVHASHRTGTEARHDTRPDEITLPPYASLTTTLTFDRPGDYAFICHLPGHEAYGMTGIVRVTP